MLAPFTTGTDHPGEVDRAGHANRECHWLRRCDLPRERGEAEPTTPGTIAADTSGTRVELKFRTLIAAAANTQLSRSAWRVLKTIYHLRPVRTSPAGAREGRASSAT
jgi:hypothetical protein